MLKKKHIVEIISVVVIAFLIGTMFNVNFMAVGSDGTDDYGVPFDKIWKAISGLQAQVDSLEERLPEGNPLFQVFDIEYIALERGDKADMLEILVQNKGNGTAHNITLVACVTFPMTSEIENIVLNHFTYERIEINETCYIDTHMVIWPFNGTIWSYNVTWVGTDGLWHGSITDEERLFFPSGNLTEIVKKGEVGWKSLERMEIGAIRLNLSSLINEWWMPYRNITGFVQSWAGKKLIFRTLEGEADIWYSEWTRMEIRYEVTVTCDEMPPQKFSGVFVYFHD